MPSRIEPVPYDPAYALQTAQAFIDVFSPPPFNEPVSLNDILAQLESDYSRAGFGGILLRAALANEIVGFSWWFDISARDLHDRWRPRFTPRDNIPTPSGRGAYLIEFGVLPAFQHHGLGQRLLKATLARIEPDHDWIALDTQKFAHAGLALLKSQAFEEVELTGLQVPTRICLMKTIRH